MKTGWTFTSSAHSSRLIGDTDSMPFRRFSQSSSTLFAPGNFPAMPMTAISVPVSSFDGCIGRPPLAAAVESPHLTSILAAPELVLGATLSTDDTAECAHGGGLEQRGR